MERIELCFWAWWPRCLAGHHFFPVSDREAGYLDADGFDIDVGNLSQS